MVLLLSSGNLNFDALSKGAKDVQNCFFLQKKILYKESYFKPNETSLLCKINEEKIFNTDKKRNLVFNTKKFNSIILFNGILEKLFKKREMIIDCQIKKRNEINHIKK